MPKLGDKVIGTFNNEGRNDVEDLKAAARNFVEAIDRHCPDGVRKDYALTLIETASMFSVKSVFEG